YAIYAYHRDTVSHRMTALYGLPGVVLVFVGFFILFGSPTDSGGVEKNFSPHQGSDTGRFGIPLIPAYQYADGSKFCFKYFIAQVTRGKIEFFIISRVVRDMHFAVLA